MSIRERIAIPFTIPSLNMSCAIFLIIVRLCEKSVALSFVAYKLKCRIKAFVEGGSRARQT
jgi:hypothetical protein